MENIANISDLRNAILMLEVEKMTQEQVLKDQLYDTFGGLKQLNSLASTFTNITSSPVFKNRLLGSVAGMAIGYFSQKLIIGASGYILRKLIVSAVQFGVTHLASRRSGRLKRPGSNIFQRIFHKRKEIPAPFDKQGAGIE